MPSISWVPVRTPHLHPARIGNLDRPEIFGTVGVAPHLIKYRVLIIINLTLRRHMLSSFSGLLFMSQAGHYRRNPLPAIPALSFCNLIKFLSYFVYIFLMVIDLWHSCHRAAVWAPKYIALFFFMLLRAVVRNSICCTIIYHLICYLNNIATSALDVYGFVMLHFAFGVSPQK